MIAKLDALAATGDARLAAIGDEATQLAASMRKVADQAALVLGENRKGLDDFVEDGLPEIQGFVEDATLLVNELSATVRDMRQDPGTLLPRRPGGPGSDAGMSAARWLDPAWRAARPLAAALATRGLRARPARAGAGAADVPRHAQIHLRPGPAQGEMVAGGGRADRRADAGHQPILVLTNGINVDYVALAFWIDRAPAMVQTLIVQSFRNAGRLVQVGTNRDRVRPQFQLVSDLRAFQLNRGNGPDMVRVVLQAQLLRMPERDTVGRESFAADRPPIGTGIDAVVEAFDEALGRVMKELVAWTIKTGNKAGA